MTTKQIADEYYKKLMKDISDLGEYDPFCPVIKEHIQEIVKQERQAFGGCIKCYGKGYSTRATQEIGAPDHEMGVKGYKKQIDEMRFCICDRGRQLEKRINQERLKAIEEKIEIYKNVTDDSMIDDLYIDEIIELEKQKEELENN